MMYIYIPGPDTNDGKPWQSARPPVRGHVKDIIDGQMEVFRFAGNEYQQLIPIDSQDVDSWNNVEYE